MQQFAGNVLIPLEITITAIKVRRAYRIPKIHLLAYLSVLNRS